MTRQLNHVETLHRPGERQLAIQLFRLLGFEPVDSGRHWFTSFVDPCAERDWSNNAIYCSEVGTEQWALEQRLVAVGGDALEAYAEMLRTRPQYSTHFGIRVGSEAELDELVERVRHAGESDAQLAGRVQVRGVYRHDEPDAIAPNMTQVFIWTDVVAAGLLTLGQHIELQWQLSSVA
ncbi:MAG TPA: hypothetical protein PKV27_08020 [Ilumatobacteraceae bacterium]|nr:hypothetical protein [Ilumatobacteraceae bacterium]